MDYQIVSKRTVFLAINLILRRETDMACLPGKSSNCTIILDQLTLVQLTLTWPTYST